MIRKYKNLYFLLFGSLFFLINISLKYPHINRDGLLYIQNALDFSGNFSIFFDLYGLPFYSIVLYYFNFIFDNYSFSSYAINFISYTILILYISKISTLIHSSPIHDKYIASLLVFSISKLMSDYIGLTIRDYIGWAFLIISFYHIYLYINFNKTTDLLKFVICIFFSCLFRIEYIFILIPVFLFIFFNNKSIKLKKKFSNNIFYLFIFLFLLLIFIFITPRSNEITLHLVNLFKTISSKFSILFYINSVFILFNKIVSLFLPFIIFYLISGNIKMYLSKSFFLLAFIFSTTLFLINYLYYLNIQISSARYFIPILLIFMPLFVCIFVDLINNKNFFVKLIFYTLVFLFISINLNKNYHYKNTDIIDIKTYIEKNNLSLNTIFFEDNRLAYYYGILDINSRKFTRNIFCYSDFKYFLIKDYDFFDIEYLDNYIIHKDSLISKKYRFIEKINNCQ